MEIAAEELKIEMCMIMCRPCITIWPKIYTEFIWKREEIPFSVPTRTQPGWFDFKIFGQSQSKNEPRPIAEQEYPC